MAFPFYPFGAITATLALGGTLFLFRLLLLVLDRGAAELRGSIGPGLVRGVRAWSDGPQQETFRGASPAPRRSYVPGLVALPAGVMLEDLEAPSGIAVEAVRSRRS